MSPSLVFHIMPEAGCMAFLHHQAHSNIRSYHPQSCLSQKPEIQLVTACPGLCRTFLVFHWQFHILGNAFTQPDWDSWHYRVSWNAAFTRRRKWKRTPVSCLGNPIDRGACWAIVHRVTKSWTRLSNNSPLPYTESGLLLLPWGCPSSPLLWAPSCSFGSGPGCCHFSPVVTVVYTAPPFIPSSTVPLQSEGLF